MSYTHDSADSAIAAAQKQERQDRMPFIAVEEIYADYAPQPDGTMKETEWVRWVKKGMQTPATCIEKISRLSKNPDNPIWQVIKPQYEAGKTGQVAVIVGTPLAAWPGATPALVKALAPCNIRSVEDLAEMEDSAIQRLAVPGLREKQKQAKAFLEAQKATAQVSGEVLKVREENEALRRELGEMRELIERFAIAQEKTEPAKRRGRPPKVQTEAA